MSRVGTNEEIFREAIFPQLFRQQFFSFAGNGLYAVSTGKNFFPVLDKSAANVLSVSRYRECHVVYAGNYSLVHCHSKFCGKL